MSTQRRGQYVGLLGGLLLLGILVAIAGLDSWLRQALKKQVSRQTYGAYQLRIGSLRTHFWPRTLALAGVQLAPDPQWSGPWPATLPRLQLTIGSVRLSGIGLLSLLRGGVVPVDSLVLRAASLRLTALPRRLSGVQPLFTYLPRHLAGVRLGVVALQAGTITYAPGPAIHGTLMAA